MPPFKRGYAIKSEIILKNDGNANEKTNTFYFYEKIPVDQMEKIDEISMELV